MTGQPPLALYRHEWDTMVRVLGSLAVAARAALHSDEPVRIETEAGQLIATITPAAAPGIIAAWEATRRAAPPP